MAATSGRSCIAHGDEGYQCLRCKHGPVSFGHRMATIAGYSPFMGRHPWYSKQRWLNLAAQQLREHPLCAKCLKRGGIVTPATVADHVVPHRGNATLFWGGALQSLCMHCHNRFKLIEELHGYTTDIDQDGWPTDPRHPANSGKIR